MIVVVGDVMTDVVVRPSGPLIPGTDRAAAIATRPGGSAANLACWLAQLGVPVRLAARVAAADRDRLRAEFAVHGVDARLAADADRPTGMVVAIVDPDGERSFYTDRGANLGLCAADLPPSLLDGATALHVSGHTLASAGPRGAAIALMRAAGVERSVDAGSVGWLDRDAFMGDLAGVSLCFANAAEAALVWPRATPSLPGGTVVVTRGADGAEAFAAGGVAHAAAVPVPITDTVGAGDSFMAGYLAARHGGADVTRCLAAAVATAARAVSVVGGRPPTRHAGDAAGRASAARP